MVSYILISIFAHQVRSKTVRFDFAISFAGKDRGVARQLSDALRKSGFEVFFDELFEHELLGQDGADYLTRVYFSDARCCVALISSNYDQRKWAVLERRSAQAREFDSGPGFLVPVLIEDYRPSWLLPTSIYFDLLTRSLSELVELLTRKISASRIEGFEKMTELPIAFVADAMQSMSVRVSSFQGLGFDQFIVWDRDRPGSLHYLTQDRKVWLLRPIQTAGAKHHVLCSGATLVSFGENTRTIDVYTLEEPDCVRYAVPRQGRWASVYDCKLYGTQVLLAFCGGDCWLFDLEHRTFTKACSGSDDPTWTYADFAGDHKIVVGFDAAGAPLRIIDSSTLKEVNNLPSPISVNALSCLPASKGILIAGVTSLYAYVLNCDSGRIEYRFELNSRGVEKLVCARESSTVALVSGGRDSAALEVFNAESGLRLGRIKTGDLGESWDEWHDVAISPSGNTIVGVRANKLIIFERR